MYYLWCTLDRFLVIRYNVFLCDADVCVFVDVYDFVQRGLVYVCLTGVVIAESTAVVRR